MRQPLLAVATLCVGCNGLLVAVPGRIRFPFSLFNRAGADDAVALSPAEQHLEQLLAPDDLRSTREAQVHEHMSRDVVTLRDDMSLKDASCYLQQHGISGAPVVDSNAGQLLGMLSQTDLLYKAAGKAKIPLVNTNGLGAATVRYASNTIKMRKARADHVVTAMSRSVVSVRPDATIQDAAALLLRHHVSRLPVVDEAGKLVGIITTTDVMGIVAAEDDGCSALIRDA